MKDNPKPEKSVQFKKGPVSVLKPQLRDPKENLSAFKVLRDAFLKPKE